MGGGGRQGKGRRRLYARWCLVAVQVVVVMIDNNMFGMFDLVVWNVEIVQRLTGYWWWQRCGVALQCSAHPGATQAQTGGPAGCLGRNPCMCVEQLPSLCPMQRAVYRRPLGVHTLGSPRHTASPCSATACTVWYSSPVTLVTGPASWAMYTMRMPGIEPNTLTGPTTSRGSKPGNSSTPHTIAGVAPLVVAGA